MAGTPTITEGRRAALEELEETIAFKRREAEAARVGEAYVAQVLESIADVDNFVNPYDYLRGPDRLVGYGLPGYAGGIATSITDRDEGQSWPIFRTEHELQTIRGLGRTLCDASSTGKGIINHLTNYTIGTGFEHKVEAVATGFEETAALAQKAIDRFLKRNRWKGYRDREFFRRKRRDGEAFIALFSLPNGDIKLRFIEPDNVLEPRATREIEDWLGISGQFPSSWSFGVHTDEDDTVNSHGYYVQWTPKPTEWDYIAGGEDPIVPPSPTNVRMIHVRANVDSNIKRGLSDFFATAPVSTKTGRLRDNIISGATGSAAIAWVEEPLPGMTSTTNLDAISELATFRQDRTTPSGGRRVEYVKEMLPGSVVTTSRKYHEGPGSTRSTDFLAVLEAGERNLAMRWGMPEHLVTGSAKNNNFASIVVASDPFTRAIEAEQEEVRQTHEILLWSVLRMEWEAGRLGGQDFEMIEESLRISIECPTVEVRDRAAETERFKKLNESRVVSRQTWQEREGLDPEQESDRIEQEMQEDIERAQAEIAAGLRPDPNAMNDPRAGGSSGDRSGDAVGTGSAGPKKQKGAGTPAKRPTKAAIESMSEMVGAVWGEGGDMG